MKHLYYLFFLVLLQTASFSQERNPTYADVVVYGATPAGIISAISASRNGANVILIEQTNHVGGMLTSGLNTAENEHMINKTITGMAREFYVKLGRKFSAEYFESFSYGRSMNFKAGDPAFYFESKIAEDVFTEMLIDEEVNLIFGRYLEDVTMQNQKIISIRLDNSQVVEGQIFIDCTYEGDLMAKSGVSYTHGRESIVEYNESYAGIRLMDDTLSGKTVDDQGELLPFFSKYEKLVEGSADSRVMNYNFRPTMTRDPVNMVSVTLPANYDPSRYQVLGDFLKQYPETRLGQLIGIYSRGNGKFEFNNQQHATISLGIFGGNIDYPDGSYSRRSEIYKDHKDYTLGYLYFLGHDEQVPKKLRDEMLSYGFAKDEFVDNDHFPYYLYIREARRMIGDYVLTQHDILTNTTKKNAVTLGSHWIDSHHVQRIAVTDSTFTNEGRIWHKTTEPFEIPYYIIIPKAEEVKNLLVPVCASLSHVAWCSYRLESTWMQMGHVAGTAAAMSLKKAVSLDKLPIEDLQYQLKLEGMIFKSDEIGIYNDYK